MVIKKRMNDFPTSEKKVRIASDGLILAGRHTILSATSPVVVLSHGFAGNKDEKGLFLDARDFFAGHGLSVLRFDFRGCGESEGDFQTVTLTDWTRDLLNVVKYLRSLNQSGATGAIGLVGFSLAAGVAVLANSKDIDGYAFWSPAVYTDRDMSPRYQIEEILQHVDNYGWFEKSGLRVGTQLLYELAGNSIQAALHSFRQPVLVVHGTDDQRIPFTSSQELTGRLHKSSKLCIIPGADHSFRSHSLHREWLLSASVAWFNKRLFKHPGSQNQSGLFGSAVDPSGDSLRLERV
jgi:pimeloyl-ACP methyl ester carboxylesterase